MPRRQRLPVLARTVILAVVSTLARDWLETVVVVAVTSWRRLSRVLFCCPPCRRQTANDNYAFLQWFFKTGYPEFATNDFYIGALHIGSARVSTAHGQVHVQSQLHSIRVCVCVSACLCVCVCMCVFAQRVSPTRECTFRRWHSGTLLALPACAPVVYALPCCDGGAASLIAWVCLCCDVQGRPRQHGRRVEHQPQGHHGARMQSSVVVLVPTFRCCARCCACPRLQPELGLLRMSRLAMAALVTKWASAATVRAWA